MKLREFIVKRKGFSVKSIVLTGDKRFQRILKVSLRENGTKKSRNKSYEISKVSLRETLSRSVQNQYLKPTSRQNRKKTGGEKLK